MDHKDESMLTLWKDNSSLETSGLALLEERLAS